MKGSEDQKIFSPERDKEFDIWMEKERPKHDGSEVATYHKTKKKVTVPLAEKLGKKLDANLAANMRNQIVVPPF
jgi:hypothetical protein